MSVEIPARFGVDSNVIVHLFSGDAAVMGDVEVFCEVVSLTLDIHLTQGKFIG